jgi:outer membrane receptor protein involved in Fe transport
MSPLAAFISATLALTALNAVAQQGPQAAAPAAAEETQQKPSADQLEEIVVFGRNLELLGKAEAASEGTVGGADLSVRPLLRVAELLEAVPGLIAVQHSGSGKANQYFLRGFNLDHGTDFTTYVDGMPWNLRSHGHGQGYLDVNGLMPETVDHIDFRKGVYRADAGDFSMAGSSFITTIDRLAAPFVSFEGGQYGWGRLATGGTKELSDGKLLTGLVEHYGYDGPWQLPEHMDHTAAWGKYLSPTEWGKLSITVSAYNAFWRPTEQQPERAIGTSACADEYCALDPTATGRTSRWIGGAQLEGDKWHSAVYLQYYDWAMQSNPTYDYQINQFDRRWTTGGRYERRVVENSRLTLNVGTEVRYDDIGKVGLDHYDAGSFVSNLTNFAIKEGSIGAYSEATWSATDKLRLIGGLRGDIYSFDVTARNPTSVGGDVRDSRMSPKVSVAYAVNRSVELYGSWGRGFHSNDARGVVNSDAPVPGLSPGEGYEAGARFEIGALKLTTAYWWLNLDSELSFDGDSNTVEPEGASRRHGYELTLFWKPIDWLGIDAVYAHSTARYVDNPDGPYIENSPEAAGEIGISAVKNRWEVGGRVRYLGPYALVPDNSERAGGAPTLNLRGAYRFGKNMNTTLYAELLNAADHRGKDIVYWYGAVVPGIDPPTLSADSVDCSVTNCRMSRPQEPRTLRVGLKVEF